MCPLNWGFAETHCEIRDMEAEFWLSHNVTKIIVESSYRKNTMAILDNSTSFIKKKEKMPQYLNKFVALYIPLFRIYICCH